MKDEELSLKIAEHLGMVNGPYPVEGKWRNVQDGTMTEITIRNMVTDPAMTVKLMEDAYFLSLKTRINGDSRQYQATFLKKVISKPFASESDWEASIGRAVAEAFARAKGLL